MIPVGAADHPVITRIAEYHVLSIINVRTIGIKGIEGKNELITNKGRISISLLHRTIPRRIIIVIDKVTGRLIKDHQFRFTRYGFLIPALDGFRTGHQVITRSTVQTVISNSTKHHVVLASRPGLQVHRFLQLPGDIEISIMMRSGNRSLRVCSEIV